LEEVEVVKDEDRGKQGGDDGIKSKLVVRTVEGGLMGKRVDNKVNKPYVAFWSVPYAVPPLGSLRFKVRGYVCCLGGNKAAPATIQACICSCNTEHMRRYITSLLIFWANVTLSHLSLLQQTFSKSV
jgi:hypothetical protein